MPRRTIFFFILIYLTFLIAPVPKVSAAGEIKLVINGTELANLPAPPVIYNDSTLVPAREVFEHLGASVKWEGDARRVIINYGEHALTMVIGERAAYLNGVETEMRVPPMIINEKTMIPLRFPAECFGFEVAWREDERAAYIYAPPPVIKIPEPDPNENPSESAENHIFDPGVPALAQDISAVDIEFAPHPETTITSLLAPNENFSASYTAVAASPITGAEWFLLSDNRLVVDILNSVCDIYAPFYIDASVPVDGIRASQFSEEPNVTRIVFDLAGAAEYSISLSADRKALTVSFSQTFVTDVLFATDGYADTVTVFGTGAPVVHLVPQNNPDRIEILIANAIMRANVDEHHAGAYVNRITTSQREGRIGCVEARVDSFSSYEIEYSPNAATVRFFASTLRNINYEPLRRSIILPKSSGLSMDAAMIRHTNDYLNNRYTLTLPVDAARIIGQGELITNDYYVKSVLVSQDPAGFTQLVVNEARANAYAVSEDAENYYIDIRLPREVAPHIVVLDPGHGGSDPGTITGGAREKDINLSIVKKVMDLFNGHPSIIAYSTRLSDVSMTREDRAAFANAIGDLFVSVHCNSVARDTAPNGIETWYHPHENDAALGFSCRQFAEIMNRNLVNHLQSNNRGLKSDEIVVLVETTMPAVLLEVGFLSNPAEFVRLNDETYQWLIAQAIYRGINEAFSVYSPRR